MPCGFRMRLGPFSAFRASIFLWRGRSAHNRGAKRSEPLLCAAGRLVCFGVWCSKGAASWDKLVAEALIDRFNSLWGCSDCRSSKN
jgi:hypothetical protein